jgi:hypothetical protein
MAWMTGSIKTRSFSACSSLFVVHTRVDSEYHTSTPRHINLPSQWTRHYITPLTWDGIFLLSHNCFTVHQKQ